MTQERINKFFQGHLGQQCISLFSTPDDRVFIRHSEAVGHCNENNLNKNEIMEWFDDSYDDEILSDNKLIDINYHPNPTKEQCFNSLESAINQLQKDHPEFQEEHSTGWDMMQMLEYIKNNFKSETGYE